MPHMRGDGYVYNPHTPHTSVWWMLHNTFRSHGSIDNSIRHQIHLMPDALPLNLEASIGEKPSAHAPQFGVTATPSAPVASVLPEWISLPCNNCLSRENMLLSMLFDKVPMSAIQKGRQILVPDLDDYLACKLYCVQEGLHQHTSPVLNTATQLGLISQEA